MLRWMIEGISKIIQSEINLFADKAGVEVIEIKRFD